MAVMKKKFSFKLVWAALKDAFKGFGDDKVTKLSASLAYYTVFSIGPLLIVIIWLAGMFLGQEAASGTIYKQLQAFIGSDAAGQIQTIIKNASIANKGGMAATIGIATLLIGATTVFGEIQDSINSIWGLKASAKAGIMRLVMSRLLSFGIIGSLGFLLLVSLAVSAVVEAIGNRLQLIMPDVTVNLLYIFNLVLNFAVITALFAIIFKVLPDIRIKLKAILPGAIATALLFMIGKLLISLYISKSQVGTTYGAAGSFVILIVWVYYSSIILYFGAEFTKAYALQKGERIVPDSYAEWTNKPAIAGAEEKKPPRHAPSEGNRKRQVHPAPKFAVSGPGHDPDRKKDTKPGIGSMLLGIALYYINSESRKRKG